MKTLLVILLGLISTQCFAQTWFDISAKPSWHTGPLQTNQNPALGSRMPWKRGKSILNVSFDTAFSATAGMSGYSHGRLLDFQSRADQALDKYLDKSTIPTTAVDITKTYSPVVMLINDFYKLKDASKGDGYHMDTSFSAGFGLHNVAMHGDAISFRYTKYTHQAWSFKLDRYLNEFIRIRDGNASSWLNDIDTAMSHWPSGYNISPITPAGWRYADKLREIGYTQDRAEFIAFLLEGSGLDFDSQSSELFLQWLENSADGVGDPIFDADVLHGNDSGVRTSILSVEEYGLTYSFNIPIEPIQNMFTIGATFKYMSASRHSAFHVGGSKKGPQLNPFSPMSDTRQSFGLDVGVVFTPTIPYFDDLALSLSARNINNPSFKWSNEEVVIPSQFRMGFSVSPFSRHLPIKIGADLDLNRIESYVLPGYHTQQFRFQFELDPGLKPVNFAIRLGAIQNVGDQGEPLRVQGGLNLKLWWFNLDFMGDTSIESIYRSSQILGGMVLPTTFSLSMQIGINVEW